MGCRPEGSDPVKAKKINFGDRTWSAFPQDHWLEMSGNPNFPDYLRILFVAYGRHAANGHARLDRQELAYFLVRKDGTLPDRRTVRRALIKAVSLGYLRPESQLLCLVVSSHDVQGGKGDPSARCRRDHTKRSGTNDGNQCGRFGANDAHQSSRSNTNDGNQCGRSVLRPSLSLVPDHERPEVPA